jgi:hypothetical protein
MRLLLIGMLILLCAGCSTGGAAPPAPAPVDQTVAELLAASPGGPVAVVGYLVNDARGVHLTGGMSFTADPPAPLPATPELWIGAEPPPGVVLETAGDRAFSLVRVVGTLEGPGAYGSAEATYRLREPAIEALTPHAIRLTALLAAASTSENQVLRISGELLSGPGTNLLVENLGPGGVPAASARQIKLIIPADDPALAERLAPGGGVRYGPVEVIGIWRAGVIHALAIVPAGG